MTGRKIFAGLLIMGNLVACQQVYSQVSYKKTYWGTTIDIAFASSLLTTPVKKEELSTLRVSNVFNIGITLNHDFSNALGVYTGIGIRNIGFIEKNKVMDSTIKRRAYCLEVPAGIKIGSLYRRRYIVLGGGADLAFHYKEKRYVRKGNKEKSGEWFGDQAPLVMPFVFAGLSFNPGVVLKLQYYPQNFLNTGYTDAAGAKPYAGYNVNLLLLSLGVDIHHHKPPRQQLQEANITQ